ncbi:MAG: reverse transcriptase domain-containing protein [Acidiferrobacterales bacterium]
MATPTVIGPAARPIRRWRWPASAAGAMAGCWTLIYKLDLDIQSFFDDINHSLLVRALRQHTDCPWVLLYVQRWLKAPAQGGDGTLVARDQGTPQGGCVSPLLSNLFLHYAFDRWMHWHYPDIPFERYADDAICHCRSLNEAQALKAALEARMAACGLRLHPQKTQVVYCRDANRTANYERCQFDFLGYTFRARFAKSSAGKRFMAFLPAISRNAATAIRQTVRRWRLHCWHTVVLTDVAEDINAVLQGWVNYYGRFYRSALYAVFDTLDQYLVRWVRRKYKRFKFKVHRAREWLAAVRQRDPRLFVHWDLAASGRQ